MSLLLALDLEHLLQRIPITTNVANKNKVDEYNSLLAKAISESDPILDMRLWPKKIEGEIQCAELACFIKQTMLLLPR